MDLVVHGHKLNVDRQFCGKWFAARLTWRFRCRSNRKNVSSSGHYYLNCQEKLVRAFANWWMHINVIEWLP